MIEELQQGVTTYMAKWQQLIKSTVNQDFFASLKPTAVAWKTVDLADFERRLVELREHADTVHQVWKNERWLATIHLRHELTDGIVIVKLMQRRPASTDSVGLDHVDFYFAPASYNAKEVLRTETELTWTEEHNGERSKWLSIWFEETEAKLRDDFVVERCIEDLQDVHQQQLAQL